jgi:hypothetical protein
LADAAAANTISATSATTRIASPPVLMMRLMANAPSIVRRDYFVLRPTGQMFS